MAKVKPISASSTGRLANSFRLWRKHWVGGYVLLSLLLVIISASNLARDIGRPFGGILTFYDVSRQQAVVKENSPGWWPGMAPGLLTPKDGIIAIAGLPYTPELGKRVFAIAAAQEKPTIPITAERDSELKSLTLPVARFTWNNFLDVQFPGFLLSLGYWLVIVTIYLANPNDPLHRVTALLGGIFVMLGMEHPSLFWQDGFTSRTLDIIALIRGAFTGVIAIHFTLMFPVRSRFLTKPVLLIMYGVGTVAAVSYLSSRLLFWINGPSAWVVRLDSVGYFILWRLILAALLLTLGRLAWYGFKRGIPPRQRREAFILLVGVVIALPHIGLKIINALLQAEHNLFWAYLDFRYLLLAIPMALAVILLRFKTFKNAPVALLLVPMLGISAILASVGAAFLRVSQPEAFDAYPLPLFFFLFSLVIAASLLWGVQSSWHGWFSRLLYWESQSYDAVRRFGQRVIEQQSNVAMPALIATALRTELSLERTAVWVWRDGQYLQLAAQDGTWLHKPPPQLALPVPNILTRTQPIRLPAQKPDTIQHWAAVSGSLHDVAVIAPLSVSGQPVGLLALGKRWDEAFFDDRDLEIIELIGQQAALFLLTSVQVEKLRRMPHQIDQAQERERFKIAGELHDTIQQFLGRLPFYLEVSRGMLQSDPEKADVILQNCITDITDAAQTVRHIRGNLAPTQLENEFVRSVSNLIENYQFRTGITTTFQIDTDLDPLTSLDTRHALYRVVQQSLDNIADHAQADQAFVSLHRDGDKIAFSIRDHGAGSSTAERHRAQAQGSFGLRAMQARIEAVRGKFQFHSSPGKGTEVAGWVPVER